MTAEMIINLATLVAAVAAAITGIWAVNKAGQQKVAEYRKEWIESLRVHIAEFISIAAGEQLSDHRSKSSNTLSIDRIPSFAGDSAETEKADRRWERMVHLASYIQLMLNQNEATHKNLEEKVFALLTKDPKENSISELVASARLVLKTEWDQLKKELKGN